MKINVNRTAFVKALRTVALASAHTNERSKYIYDAVLIKADICETSIQLVCAEPNMPKSISVNVPAEIDFPDAKMAVNVRNLLRLVLALRGDQVTLTLGQKITSLTVGDGLYTFKIPTIEPDRTFAAFVPDLACDQTATGMLAAARRVMFAASTDEGRPVLQAISFNGAVVATNGFQIAVLPKSIEGVNGLIPAEILRLAGRIFRKVDPMVGIQDGKVALSDGVTTLTTNLITGKFPDYMAIVPRKYALTVEFVAADLRRAMNAVQVCQKANNYSPVFHLEIQENYFDNLGTIKATITATSVEHEFSTVLYGNLVNQDSDEIQLPFEIAFNAQFIDDVAAQSGKRVQIAVNAVNTPAIVRPADQADPWFSVVMPMHLG